MDTFPTTSTSQIDLHSLEYDLAQLSRAVDAAIAGKVIQPEPVCPNHFHVHTLTIQATPATPVRFEQYPDGPRDNPNATVFEAIFNSVKAAKESCVPLVLSIPGPKLFHIPPFDQKNISRQSQALSGRSPDVFLPTTHGKTRPLIRLRSLPIPRGQVGTNFYVSATGWDIGYWLHAALALDPSQQATRKGNYRDEHERVHLRTGVSVIWLPATEEGGDPELKLIVTVDVYLDMEVIEIPLSPVGTDLFSLVLVAVLPAEASRPATESRASALQQFYESLRPAPDLPLGFDARLLQPNEMASKLLPFQTRTLALLLEREGAPIAGEVKELKSAHQWSKMHFEGFGDYAFQRLTGRLVKLTSNRKGKDRETACGTDGELDALPHLFNLGNVRGTMLCEEMGLGKTVEAIALMLLHRHPLSVTRPPAGASADVPTSSVIDLRTLPASYGHPKVKAWLQAEHTAFDGTTSWSEESQLHVAEVAATLVVTPLPLLKQWVTEMRTHAPGLRIGVYPGWKVLISQIAAKRKETAKEREKHEAQKLKRKNVKFRNKTRTKYSRGHDGSKVKVELESESESEDEVIASSTPEDSLLDLVQRAWLDYLRGHDVIITTYQTLGDDLAVAHPAPIRSRRSTAKYNIEERPRSPLVMVEWWRVIMDEVQLQGDQSAAAEMVSLIPRKCSLAMSGTPARNDVHDLMGSLRFLRVPHAAERQIWHRLLQDENRLVFHGLFQALSVRTTKVEVAGEFNLPHQTRFVVPIELSDIEMHYYLDTLDRQQDRLRRNDRDGRSFDRSVFFSSLRHLRQICTHIQVGALQRGAANPVDRADRIQLGRNLMNMDEALKKMRADNEAALVTQIRNQMRHMILKAQLMVLDDTDDLRHLKALSLYERARTQGQRILDPARAALNSLIGDREDSVDDEAALRSASQAERDRARQLMTARQAIRETLLLIHQSWFLEGDVRHVEKEEDAEVVAYKMAEDLRKDILARPLKLAYKYVEGMCKTMEEHPAIESLDNLYTSNTRYRGGISTHDAVIEANALLRILNDNASLVFNWRAKVIKLLQTPLEAEEDAVPAPGQGQDVENPEEEYYAEALKAQGDVEAYLTAYAAVIADRKEFLLEQRTALAEHEGDLKKKRVTNRAKEAELNAAPVELSDVDDLTLKLMLERQAFRDRRNEEDCTRPLKAILIDISNVVHSGARVEEVEMAKETSSALRKYINQQTEFVDKLYKELDVLRATFNKRVMYFASLQEISDSVAAPMFKDLRKDIAEADRQITRLEGDIARNTVKGRYLSYLDNGNGERDVHEECSICFGTSEDKHAVLLACGHAFCVSCFREYRKAAYIGRKCATCKADINERQFTKIRIRHDDQDAAGESQDAAEDEEEQDQLSDDAERAARMADLNKLNMLPEERQREIMAMDMMGEYGSKINFLIKHLLYTRLLHPDTRHVVFSNWADSLHIVERALRENRIRFVSFDSNSKKNDVVEQFHSDPTISVFLLHAERESAGLTLTSCGVVHLLEPVLQHSFELQAIGRVDRLGQKKQTEVYCYATMETVEARILSQGVRNGTSIYLADKDADARVVEAMPNVASAASRGGDLVLNTDDAAATAQMLSLIM